MTSNESFALATILVMTLIFAACAAYIAVTTADILKGLREHVHDHNEMFMQIARIRLLHEPEEEAK